MKIIRTVIINATQKSISGHVLIEGNIAPPILTFLNGQTVIGHCQADKVRDNSDVSGVMLGFNFTSSSLKGGRPVTIKYECNYLISATLDNSSRYIMYTDSSVYRAVNASVKNYISANNHLINSKPLSNNELLYIKLSLCELEPEYLLYCLLVIRGAKLYHNSERIEEEIKLIITKLKLNFFIDMGEVIPIFYAHHSIARGPNEWLNSYSSIQNKGSIKYQGKNNEVVNLFNEIINEKGLKMVSPITGNHCFSNTIKGMNLFHFPDDDFYTYLNFGPMMQHSIGFLSLFSYACRFMVFIDKRKDKLGMPVGDNQIKAKLEHSYKTAVLKLKLRVKENIPSKIMLSNRGVGHFGHGIWNDFSIFNDLIMEGTYQRKDVIVSCCKSFYIKNNVFLKKQMNAHLSGFYLSPNEMIKDCIDKNIIPIFLSNDFISEKTANLTKETLFKDQADLSIQSIDTYDALIADKELILLSIRAGARTCLNEVDIYSSLINEIKKDSDKFIFAIDGVNLSDNDMSSSFQDIKKLDGLNKIEIDMANEIEERTGVSLIKCVNLPLTVSIFLSSKAYKIISPWGAGLVKYKWIENKDCFIYGSNSALSKKHPHKNLYDLPSYRQYAVDSTYYTGRAEDLALDRDTSYKINKDDFIEQVKKFIFNE